MRYGSLAVIKPRKQRKESVEHSEVAHDAGVNAISDQRMSVRFAFIAQWVMPRSDDDGGWARCKG